MIALFVFGTRPEAIKMAPIIKEFKSNKKIETKVCITAQHRQMLDQVLDFFEIIPDYDLNIMKNGQDLFDITSNVLLEMRDVIKKSCADMIFVHGDTATTFAATLAAYYLKVRVAHVEAGLRTYDLYSPWPEEGNRQLVSRLADIHFAPTTQNMLNLIKEGISKEIIHITGNSVVDALFWAKNKIFNSDALQKKIKTGLYDAGLKFNLEKEKFVLITGHRRENFGKGMMEVCAAIKCLALKHKNINFVYPVHLNPNVQEPVNKYLSCVDNIYLIEPLSYEVFVYLMQKSYLILTDSGGIQEEAPSLGKPVLVTRNTTERTEAISAGTIKLVGTDARIIQNEFEELLLNDHNYSKMANSKNPYGDGLASINILNLVLKYA